MSKTRSVQWSYQSRPTLEGAGVRLRRAFGYSQVPRFDPFLLLDDIHSSNPQDYMAGFPWHPHRGIETVTYVISGTVEHGDSMGNSGSIGEGEVQWMTAGSGIVHQEMPKRAEGDLWGLQLWVNLPAKDKMMDPRYRGITAGEIPTVTGADGVEVRVVAGRHGGADGPVSDLVRAPTYLDVFLPPEAAFERDVPSGDTVFAYVLSGDGVFDGSSTQEHGARSVVLFGDGDRVHVTAGPDGLRFLLISGTPLREPVAWGGPIVMNTQEELEQAFEDYRKGTFIKGV